ncbi:MAG: hypothetical protein U9R72_16970 [Chloroflexota bacterium]|nr:hypothetical protein [Chloroflexota bacterium]
MTGLERITTMESNTQVAPSILSTILAVLSFVLVTGLWAYLWVH